MGEQRDMTTTEDQAVVCPECLTVNTPGLEDDSPTCTNCGAELVIIGGEEIPANVSSGVSETNSRAFDPATDNAPETDSDHDFWNPDGTPIVEAWLEIGQTPPQRSRDNLVRAAEGHVEWRETTDNPMGQLYGIFSEFNSWYPISSAWEGDFLERIAPGAFTDTIKNDRSSMRVLFDHGMDPSLGNKPLGAIRTLEERDNGPYYEVDLYNTDYNRGQIVPLLRGELLSGATSGSALGSSFRFQVQRDQWTMQPKVTKANPNGLPQRTILQAKVFEFGPVCFPANPGATACARSMTDEWLVRLIGARRESIPAALRHLADSVPHDFRTAQSSAQRRAQLKRRAQALLIL